MAGPMVQQKVAFRHHLRFLRVGTFPTKRHHRLMLPLPVGV
jgi:hypothetical protein